eukprot:gene7382-517_t
MPGSNWRPQDDSVYTVQDHKLGRIMRPTRMALYYTVRGCM